MTKSLRIAKISVVESRLLIEKRRLRRINWAIAQAQDSSQTNDETLIPKDLITARTAVKENKKQFCMVPNLQVLKSHFRPREGRKSVRS